MATYRMSQKRYDILHEKCSSKKIINKKKKHERIIKYLNESECLCHHITNIAIF